MNALGMALAAALFAQAAPAATATSSPTPAPAPTGPVYSAGAPARFTLITRRLGFDPDGNARFLVVTKLFDAQGNVTRSLANTDFDYTAGRGYVQWQTRLRYGQPSAIIKTTQDGPLVATVRANVPRLGSVSVHTDTRAWKGARVVAAALGPHLVQIGWFPQERRLVRIVRLNGDGSGRTVGIVAGPSSTYRDTHVLAGHSYRYIVYRASAHTVKLPLVRTPPAPQDTPLANAGGKAMWLYFTSDPLDPLYYQHLDPEAIVDQAVRAGLHYVELRTAYGAYFEITPQAKPTIDAIIDGLAAHGIGTIGWTVPRDTTFEDLAATTRTAYYRTAKGTRLTGIAIDIERGEEFMGDDPQKLNALWLYAQYLRQAMGPKYLIAANVEDPYLEHLDNKKYPYPQIARFVSVLQPMSYWRMMRRKPTTPAQVKVLLRGSYNRLLYLSGRKLPVSIGGQTTAEGRNGYPPADEITASLDVSRQLGAIGEIFFAWDGTQPYQWEALQDYTW